MRSISQLSLNRIIEIKIFMLKLYFFYYTKVKYVKYLIFIVLKYLT